MRNMTQELEARIEELERLVSMLMKHAKNTTDFVEARAFHDPLQRTLIGRKQKTLE
jgi:archaellum component FlaC